MKSMKIIRGILFLGMLLLIAGCGEKTESVDEGNNKEYTEDMTHELFEEDEVLQDYLLNPISSIEEDQWYDYGTGDPFVMRYNGMYYLYMSTRDNEVGVKCFSSKDLVNWKYEGLCAEEKVTKGAYAPEVVYYNGKFYMYTSPAGNGHYVFESESPLGPFLKCSNNQGLSIDGSVFIDDDGKWYFYHASDEGILANEMSSPNEISQRGITVNAYMNGWTEGPAVIKQDGKYYITYTGNHVFAKGYRIDCGVGDSCTKFTKSSENPILLNTSEEVYGIGHSSTVKGPNLDSYYIVYHSLIGRAVEGMPKRVMNIDRLEFNGSVMTVLGPTVTKQEMPSMPDLYSYFSGEKDLTDCENVNAVINEGKLEIENGFVVSKEKIPGNETIEYNISSKDETGSIGGYFDYTDESNYGKFYVELDSKMVYVSIVKNGNEKVSSFNINKSFDEEPLFNVNETFQIEKTGNKGSIYYNDRLLGEFTDDLESGSIGYFSEAAKGIFGFIGGTGATCGDSINDYERPVPGSFQAVNAKATDGFLENSSLGFNSIISTNEAASSEYLIRVKEDGIYSFSMTYQATVNGTVTLYEDDNKVIEIPYEKTDTNKVICGRNLSLSEGSHTLRILVSTKDITIDSFSFTKETEVYEYTYEFDSILNECVYSDGSWRMKDGVLKYNENADSSTGKQFFGDTGYGDYEVSEDIVFTGDDIYTGLIVRAKNPSLGGAGNDPVAGFNFFQGYCVMVMNKGLLLQKINYNSTNLQKYEIPMEANKSYNIRVKVEKNNIKIYLDDKEIIDYTDNDHPFLNGMVGVRTMESSAEVERITIK